MEGTKGAKKGRKIITSTYSEEETVENKKKRNPCSIMGRK